MKEISLRMFLIEQFMAIRVSTTDRIIKPNAHMNWE